MSWFALGTWRAVRRVGARRVPAMPFRELIQPSGSQGAARREAARGPMKDGRIEEAASGGSSAHLLLDLVGRDRFHCEGAEVCALIKIFFPLGRALCRTPCSRRAPEVAESRLPSRSVSTVFARSHPGQATIASGASPHHGDYCRLAAPL
jgi:hypothetical protein